MMKNHGLRRIFSLFLAVFMVCALLPTAAFAEDTTEPKAVVVDEGQQEPKQEEVKTPADDGESTDVQPQADENGHEPAPQGSKPVTITVRVFVPSTGAEYTVGTDTAGAGEPGQIQSADYKIPPLTKFVDASKFGKVTGVYGNWYFPSTMNQQPGVTVQWSTNSGTGTMTYYVDWYKPDGGSSGGDNDYLWNFTLKYDANSGTGAPADQTWGTNDKYTKSYTFNIPSTIPTREGYVFKGWSDTKGGSVTRQPGGTCLVSQTVSGYNGGSVTKTLYAVWEKATPPTPDKPDAPSEEWVIGQYKNVTVKCISKPTEHGEERYDLTADSITFGKVEDGATEGTYTCFVTVSATSYVNQFNGKHGEHTAKNQTVRMQMHYDHGVWSVPSNGSGIIPIVFQVECSTTPEPVKPGKPGEDDLKGIDLVKIVCARNAHDAKTYGVIADSCEFGEISNTGDGYTCDVTINAQKYVEKYNEEVTGVTHTLVGESSKHLTLVWNADEQKWVPMTDTPVTFEVICPPAAPDHDELSKLIGDITVNCTSAAATHTPKSKGYALIADSYTRGTVVENTDGGYTYAVTIQSEKYVNQFDTDTGAAHTPKDGKATVEFEYTDMEKGWTVKSGTPVSFNVACVTEIVPPEKPVPADLGSFIKVICTTKKDVHGTAIYPLHEGKYTIGEVEGNAKDGYTCTITIEAAGYVAAYSNAKGEEHTLVRESDASKTVTLTWDSEAKNWSRPDDVTFEVKCKDEIVPPTAPTFKELPEISVTVDCGTTTEHEDATWRLLENSYEVGKVELKDDVYTCILTVKAGKYVDAYNSAAMGVGKHELDDDSTKDIVLTWKDGKWTAEKSSVTFKVKCELYTVTYTDGVKNKVIFKDDVHENLAYGTATPKFTGGTPKRTGYTFTGWKPTVADKVTGTVVYEAQWKSNSGKDSVPKTGDGQIVMILGSVLMFSFCGAAAVCVCDRKRKQG